jgi:hypothetical protein
MGDERHGQMGLDRRVRLLRGAALRLARFNTNIGSRGQALLSGLAQPGGGGAGAGFVWIINDLNIPGEEVRWYAFALTLFCGITMVSTLPYWSGKDINLRRSVPFMVLPAIVLGYVLVSSYPPGVLFALFLAYALSGYVMALLRGNGANVEKLLHAPSNRFIVKPCLRRLSFPPCFSLRLARYWRAGSCAPCARCCAARAKYTHPTIRLPIVPLPSGSG